MPIKGQWGGAPYEDQMKAVDVAVTWPYVDATRLAAAGGGYGGYMANWLWSYRPVPHPRVPR